MLFRGLTLGVLIARAIVLLVGMSVHEFAHAYGAYLMGDTTARDMGRMTLDPRANMNVVGFVFGLLTGFGFLGSAPVNQYRMRDPRRGMVVAVALGPISNLLVAILFALPVKFGLISLDIFSPPLFPTIGYLFYSMIRLNLILFVFNLLPFYPLDGWTIILNILPHDQAVFWEQNRQTNMYIGLVLILLSWTGLPVLDWIIGTPVSKIFSLII